MIFIRWGLSLVLAGVITFGLFYFMQALIATGDRVEQNLSIVRVVDATMPEIELEVIEEIDKPEPIEDLNEPPPEQDQRQVDLDSGPSLAITRTEVDIDADLNLGNASISITDGEMLPLVNVTPQYPTRAASRGIQGWCQVSFTVDGDGNVLEDTIVVVDAEPPNIFNRSSVRAAARFKFQPRVQDGVGVAVPNVQYVFRYVLEE
ncbi:MAG: energy transducer TonB [Gammaproteobacteria bacterium]|nr:energy transducer TonB [Gammaproteobacteria bacterium]